MSSTRSKQSLKQEFFLRAHSRQRATNAAKGRRSLHTAKDARHFWLNVDHANAEPGQMVVTGNLHIQQASQDVRCASQQAIEQMAGCTLCGSASCAGKRQSWRMHAIRIGQQTIRVVQHGKQDIGGNHPLLVGTGVLRADFHAHEQTCEIAGPLAVVLLPEKQPCTQQMNATQGMARVRLQRAGPSVMHTDALKVRSHPDRIQCLLASAGMRCVMDQGWRAAGMHPLAFALDRQPGFILGPDRRVEKRVCDPSFHWLQFSGGTGLHRSQRRLRERHAQQIGATLGSAGLW